MRFRFGFDTVASPAQVLDAFTDFSERRLEVWSKSLDPAKYELRELGDTWAVAREGSAGTKIWVLLRYDWSEPGHVRWTLVDSDHCDTGTGDIRISPRPGGSRVDVEIDHGAPRGVRGKAILLVQRAIGPTLFPRLWRSALDQHASRGWTG